MSKIYIVDHEWRGIGYYDGGGDCVDTVIEKIFDSEEKAVVYIQEEIRKLLENNTNDPDYDEFIDSVPSTDEIRKERFITYRSSSYDESTYAYLEYEVY